MLLNLLPIPLPCREAYGPVQEEEEVFRPTPCSWALVSVLLSRKQSSDRGCTGSAALRGLFLVLAPSWELLRAIPEQPSTRGARSQLVDALAPHPSGGHTSEAPVPGFPPSRPLSVHSFTTAFSGGFATPAACPFALQFLLPGTERNAQRHSGPHSGSHEDNGHTHTQDTGPRGAAGHPGCAFQWPCCLRPPATEPPLAWTDGSCWGFLEANS